METKGLVEERPPPSLESRDTEPSVLSATNKDDALNHSPYQTLKAPKDAVSTRSYPVPDYAPNAKEDGMSPPCNPQASGLSTKGLGRRAEKTSFHEGNESNFNSDDETEDGILDSFEAFLKDELRHPTGTDSCGRVSMVTPSMPRRTKQDKMAVIRDQLLESLSASEAGLFCASLKIQWDILGFMEDQFRDNDFPNTALGPVVTISGSAQHAQAMTCSDYVRQNWPTHGSEILNTLQDALSSPTHTSQSELVTRIDHGSASGDGAASRHANLDIDVNQEKFFLKISSTSSDVIADVVQQLIWMGAALQTSRDNRVQYCDPVLEGALKPEGAEPAVFNVLYDMWSPAEDEQSCWFPLFTNPVIAYGFPTAHRNDDEVGLEIPLDMMAALGGARQAVEYGGGLVLKGYSALFVPIKRQKESVQWHLISAVGENRISYREASIQCPNRALLKEFGHEALRTTRAYLGWWKEAETHLGTAGADYESLDWSPAGEAKRSPRFSSANMGFQSIVTGQVTFIPGTKDGRLHFSQKGPFQRIVQRAEKTPVVLYDIEDRRAWLTPALDVMLHIVETRHRSSPYNVDGRNVELTPVIPEKGRGAAREAVAANRLRQLYESDITVEKGYYYKDVILDIWSQMDFMMEKDDSIEACPGLALHGTMQSKIHGWEFMSLVNEKNYRRKEATIAKSSGGWVDLVNDIDALVLFATGFGDVIRPVSGLKRLCRQWRSLPKSKDYLAAGVPIMELLYSEAGSRLSRKHLSNTHLQWHRRSTLFEQCDYTGPGQCECDRTQQIYHDSLLRTFGRVRPPGELEENGCVLFGQVHHSLKPTKKVAIRENAVHMLPNTSIQDSAIAKDSLTRYDAIQSPSSPASFSPKRAEVNGDVVRSPKRPPSPLSFHENITEEIVARKRRRKMSRIQTPNVDPCEGPSDCDDQLSLSDDCTPSLSEYQSMLRHNTLSNDPNLGYAETVCASKAECAPLHAQKTIRHKANIDNYSHRHGCTCTVPA